MAEYKSRKKRWMPKRKMLVIALCVLTCVPSTRGVFPDIQFQDRSDDSWKFLFGANSKELLYDYCKYNATSEGVQCKNFPNPTSVDFEKVCNCTIQHNKTIEGSISFDLSCNSNLSYCPKKLSLTYEQGSYARAPDPDVPTSEINGWLVVSIISIAVNALLIILYLCKEKVHDFLKRKWNHSRRIRGWGKKKLPTVETISNNDGKGSNRTANSMIDDVEIVDEVKQKIEHLQQESHDVSENDERGNTHKRPEGVANLGFFESQINERVTKQNADNVCVLVIHYEFKNNPEKFRKGDACDVERLKTSFGKNRNCNFRNLSPNKKTLLQLLGDQDKLLQLFNTQDDVPSVFVLFILSHGEKNGKILTDQVDKETNDYERFTTDEVFNSLLKLKKFEKCLKVVNFGPGREKLDGSNRNSCRITTRPEMHNYVVFYSTVEGTPANTDEKGSWFVRYICTCLNNADDEPLLKFFTIVQNRMPQASRSLVNFKSNTPLGQTPELKIFHLDRKFVFSKEEIAISYTDGSGAESKVSYETLPECYFPWKSDEGQDIRSRRGFIFSVGQSKQEVQEMKRVLQNLDFEITDWTLSGQNVASYAKIVSELEPDVGCILTCILGPVCENEQKEVCVRVQKDQEIPITDILYGLIDPQNDKLKGKPKILIVVNVEAPQTDNIPAVDLKDLQVSTTNHSGWLVFILKCEDALEKLIELFGKIGEKSLQELLEPLLTRGSNIQDVVLLNSTLQYLINFPVGPGAFVQPDSKLKKTQIFRDQMDNSKHSTKYPFAEKIKDEPAADATYAETPKPSPFCLLTDNEERQIRSISELETIVGTSNFHISCNLKPLKPNLH